MRAWVVERVLLWRGCEETIVSQQHGPWRRRGRGRRRQCLCRWWLWLLLLLLLLLWLLLPTFCTPTNTDAMQTKGMPTTHA